MILSLLFRFVAAATATVATATSVFVSDAADTVVCVDLTAELDGGLDPRCHDLEARVLGHVQLEEAGVRLGELTHLGQIWSIPTVVTEKIDYFLAEYRAEDRIAAGGGLDEEQEHISVHELPLDELWTLFADKKIGDGKLAITLMALRLRRPDLFSVPVG